MSNDNNENIGDKKNDWANGIGFIFKKCSAPRASLAYWVTVPEFVEEIKMATERPVTIDNEYVLNIMKKIYLQKQEDREKGCNVEFNFHLSRQSLKVLSENVTGDRSFWKNKVGLEGKNNNKLGFLYKKISSLSNSEINALLSIDDFSSIIQDAVRSGATINNEWFYKNIENLVFPMMNEHSGNLDYKKQFKSIYGENEYKKWRNKLRVYQSALRKICDKCFGNEFQWLTDYETQFNKPYVNPEKLRQETIVVPVENKDMEYLLDVCNGLSKSTLRTLVSDEKIVKKFRRNGKVSNAQEAFDVFKMVFYKAARRGDKSSEDIKIRSRYYKLRNVSKDFSRFLYGDENYWHKDYADFFNSTSH